jgi:hypothetical protein
MRSFAPNSKRVAIAKRNASRRVRPRGSFNGCDDLRGSGGCSTLLGLLT